MILWLIGQSNALGLPYVYLGFLVEGCSKMDYKGRFRPLERVTPQGWVRMEG